MMAEDPLWLVAESAARESYPVAECKAIWSDRSGGEAVVVLEVVHEHEVMLHQVCCLRDGDIWVAWTEDLAPGWLPIDEPFGVVTRAQPVEAGTETIRLEHLGEEREVAPAAGYLFQALWDVTLDEDEDLALPVPVAIRVNSEWFEPALPGLPVRREFLVNRYLQYHDAGLEQDSWASEAVEDEIDDHPLDAWPIVHEAIERAPNETVLSNLAAAELETLVSLGDASIRAAIEVAGSSARVRAALRMVWPGSEDERQWVNSVICRRT